MSAPTSTLPAGWSKILDEMHLRLDHAITSTNERIDNMPHLDATGLLHERHQEIIQWCARLQRLSNYLDEAEQIVQSVDESLGMEEMTLRKHLSNCASLKQKLAETRNGAIV